MLKVLFVVLVSLIAQTFGQCPSDRSIMAPCTCNDNGLMCPGSAINEEVLEKVMGSLNSHLSDNQKHFSEIRLIGTNLIHLKENVFKNLTFDLIELKGNLQIESIATNAFNATNFKTKSIILNDLSALKQSPQSFFDVLSKMVNIESIYLGDSLNITEIPSSAFKPLNGHQNHLKTIDIKNTWITKIGTRAFYYLNSLEVFNFKNGVLSHISNYSFEFEKKSTNKLVINLVHCISLTPTSLEINSLRSIQRPTTIYLFIRNSGIYFEYLDETVFKPFMLADPHNLLTGDFISVDCNDCRNAWLKEYPSIIQYKWTCLANNKINFEDTSTFSQCKKYQ